MLPCLVLGGGLGSRLGTLTESIPKPLVPVAGEPFVRHQLRWLAAQQVTTVVYSLGYLGHLIRRELTDGPDLGCDVRFVDEGDQLLGTGGAVRFAIDEGALDAEFLVLYGDSYLQVDVSAVVAAYRASHAEALMTVHANEGAWDISNVVLDRDRVHRYDKSEPDPAGSGMRHIDYGLSVLRADTVRRLVPAGRTEDLADAMRTLSAEGGLAGFEVRERFYEIGSPAGLAELDAHLRAGAQ